MGIDGVEVVLLALWGAGIVAALLRPAGRSWRQRVGLLLLALILPVLGSIPVIVATAAAHHRSGRGAAGGPDVAAR